MVVVGTRPLTAKGNDEEEEEEEKLDINHSPCLQRNKRRLSHG
jgi:hypothetical protein